MKTTSCYLMAAGGLWLLAVACQPAGQPANEANRDSLAQTQPDSPVVTKAQLLADTRARLGEGALWHAESQTLYWIDIENGRLHRYHPATQQTQTTELGQRIGTVVPTSTGHALVALQDGIYYLDLATGKRILLAAPEKDLKGNRFNDGKCDPAGRFWAGTMSYEGKPKAGKLYCLYPDGHLEPKLDSVGISNGIVWSLDKTKMYYIDTPTGKVQEFAYDDATGAIAYVRDAVVVPPTLGYPDGSTLDSEGKLWIALWNRLRDPLGPPDRQVAGQDRDPRRAQRHLVRVWRAPARHPLHYLGQRRRAARGPGQIPAWRRPVCSHAGGEGAARLCLSRRAGPALTN